MSRGIPRVEPVPQGHPTELRWDVWPTTALHDMGHVPNRPGTAPVAPSLLLLRGKQADGVAIRVPASSQLLIPLGGNYHREQLRSPRHPLRGYIHDKIMSASDPMSSIPVHAFPVALLQQLKPRGMNWDEFLLSTFEEWLPPETVKEIERREKEEQSRSFAEVERRHPNLRRHTQ